MYKKTVHKLKLQNAVLIKENKELKDMYNKLTHKLKDVKKVVLRELLSQNVKYDTEINNIKIWFDNSKFLNIVHYILVLLEIQ